MNRFSPDLLRMMLTEEREKFLSALEAGASWKELNRIRNTISQLNNLLDEQDAAIESRLHRYSSQGPESPPSRH